MNFPIFFAVGSGWLAFVCDFYIVSKMSSGDLGSVLYVYIVRSTLYLINIFLVILNQMRAEVMMRQAGAAISEGKLEYWYGALAHYIPHYLVSSVIRVFSELLPLLLFIFVILFYNPNFSTDLFIIFIAVVLFLAMFFFIQRKLTRNAVSAVSDFVSQTSEINLVEKSVSYHSASQKNFLKVRKAYFGQKFEKYNTLAVGFSQSIRFQVEIVVVVTIFLFANNSFRDPAMLYVLFRLGSSALQVVSIVSSITHYYVYYKDMVEINPKIRFFGDHILRLINKK